jgi:hypothetical protein
MITKYQKKKNKQKLLQNIFKLLALVLFIFLILAIIYTFYFAVYLKFKEAKILNDNISLYNSQERKTSAILNDISQKITFNTKNSETTRENLEMASQENQKLTEIITTYQNLDKKLKTSSNKQTQNVNQEIANSFQTKARVIANFQEVNNYLICLGRQTLSLKRLEEELLLYSNNQSLFTNQESIQNFEKKVSELSQTADRDINNIPNCFTQSIKKYQKSELESVIKQTQEVLSQKINIRISQQETEENLQDSEIPLFLDQNRIYLESPLELLNQSEKDLETANQKIKQKIQTWKENLYLYPKNKIFQT